MTFEWHGQSFVHGVMSALAWVAWGPWWGAGAFAGLLAINLLASPWDRRIVIWPRPKG